MKFWLSVLLVTLLVACVSAETDQATKEALDNTKQGEVLRYYVTGDEVREVEGFVVYAPLKGQVWTDDDAANVYLLYKMDKGQTLITE